MVEVNHFVASQIQEKRSSELFEQSYPPDTGRKEKEGGRERKILLHFLFDETMLVIF